MSKPKIYSNFTVTYEKNLPSNVLNKADQVFAAYEAKTLHANKVKRSEALTLEIGGRYRAICRNKNEAWLVCSHETYNKKIRQYCKM